jgi:hypothetical protein
MPGDDRLPLLLEICEDYLAPIGPNGYYEVDAFSAATTSPAAPAG